MHRPEIPAPRSLQVELGSHCNLKCRMCPLTTGETLSGAQPAAMDGATWLRVREAALAAGEVVLTGFGEALASVETLPRLRELDALGVRMGLTTNGTPATPAVAQALAALRHLVHVNVSIDSPDPVTYRDVRGGDLDKALRGAANLVAAMGAGRVTVSSLLMGDTLASLEAFPRVLAGIGVQRWILQGLIDYTERSAGVPLGAEAAARLARVREAAAGAGVAVTCTLPERLDLELAAPERARQAYREAPAAPASLTRQCALPWEMPYVDKDGRVFPCCFAATALDAVLGNLHEAPLAAIWAGEPFARFREGLRTGEAVPRVCRGCNVVPLGEHPFARFAAALETARLDLDGPDTLVVVARNTGRVAWTPEVPVRVGTSGPRDRPSALHHPSWPSRDRAAAAVEGFVPPGALATFRFRVNPGETLEAEAFELVADGVAWLPGTRFVVPPKAEAVVDGYAATLAEGIDFAGRPGYPAFLRGVRGFSHPEPEGRWTDGPCAVLVFREPLPTRFVLRIETARAFDPVAGRPLGIRVGDWQASPRVDWLPEVHEVEVRTAAPASEIAFTIDGAASPLALGTGSDPRRLGVQFRRVSVRVP